MSSVARRYFERGVAAYGIGDLQVAIEQLQAAIDLAPGFGNARVAYAVALAKSGDCPRAAQILRTGLPRATSAIAGAALWATLGDVLTLGGDFFAAEDAFRQAGAVAGFEVRAASGLARVYAKLGRFSEVVAELKKAAAGSAAATSLST